MNELPLIRGLFVVSGLYDAILGAAFLLAGPTLFARLGIGAPNHWAYVHFPSLLLVIFGAMFFALAKNPVGNRNLIPYGVMLKLAYSGTVFYYWAASGIPTAWKPFALLDLLFLLCFVWAYLALQRKATVPARA